MKARRGVPPPSSDDARRRLQATKRRDTAPEVALRSILHRRGLRFRVDMRPLPESPRRADVVFPRLRIAVYVDGCFWHACPIHGSWPKSNAEFWREKLETNQRRDADTDRALSEAGWVSIRVWEHEDPAAAAARVVATVASRRSLTKKITPKSTDPVD